MPSSAHPASTSPAPKPSLPSPAKEQPAAAARASPPVPAPSHDDDAQNESEAETVVLSDAGIKTEDDVDAVVRSAASSASKKETNGAKHGSEHDGRMSAPTSPSSRTTSRPEQQRSPAEPPESPSHAASSPSRPVTTRGRSQSAVESRKRKLREDSSPKAAEPARQKPKIDGLARDTPGHRNQPPSPAPSGTHPHKRSASTQSVLQGVQGRKRRELSSIVLPSMERKTWSDTSSETSSSPRPVLTPNIPPHARVKRSSHRALTSPARAMMPKKNVDRFGATRLARECEKGDLEAAQAAFNAAPEELNQEDFAGIAPLQKASLNGHFEIVEFLLDQGCRTDCESNDRDTPLIDAVENGHLEVVKLLLGKAKVNPHHQNKKGQRAIDVLNDDEDDMKEIEKELKQAMRRETNTLEDADNATGASEQRTTSRLLYNEFNTETLIEKAGEGDILAVGELLNSNIKPNIACGVAAARGGHYDILSILLASGLKADPDPSKHSETPMLVTIGRGHLRIIKLILEQDSFDPTKRNREGRTYFEISEEREGPKWEQERDLLKAAYDRHRVEHKSPKRNRKEAQSAAPARPKRKSSPQRERSSSPRHETRRIQHTHTKFSTAPQKTRGRLISGRELSNQRDAKKRRRQVVDDETASSESDESPEPQRKPIAKRRSYSEDQEQKAIKKPIKSRVENRESKRRASGAHSEDSEEENSRKAIKKPLTKSKPSEREKSRDIKPTPDAESPDDRKAIKKMIAKARIIDREKSKETKSTIEDKSGDEAKSKKAPIPAAEPKKTTAPPEKATTPEAVLQSRREEAERRAAEVKRKAAEEEAVRKAEEEAARKAEEETARKAEEEALARKAAEEEAAKQKAEAEAEAKRLADEAARIAAENEARRLAEEKAKEVARLERLSKLPTVLKRAAELGSNRPLHFSGDEMGISAGFLPLYKVALQDIDPSVQADDPWMMSFQAAGILGLPELDLAYMEPPYSEWSRKEVTPQQRELFLRKYDIAKLAQDYRFPMEGEEDFNYKKIQQSINDAKEQFLSMEGLYWIPLDSFAMVAKEIPALKDLMGSICSSKAWPAHIKEESRSPGFVKRPSFMDVLMEQQPRTNGVEKG
ncbi:hypothetical protein BU16DRAFT_37148 [Lophium mytilinum]|uniref:Ankyrin n=1 Tax=Lophium mytilinum TaxID=390894 RepID=A0A6A6RFI3_9PEZI|nr:hypothetical protein BU16DRAFT_37148 [Lophium mytilinum]